MIDFKKHFRFFDITGMPNTTFERFLGLVKMCSVQIAVAISQVFCLLFQTFAVFLERFASSLIVTFSKDLTGGTEFIIWYKCQFQFALGNVAALTLAYGVWVVIRDALLFDSGIEAK